MQFLIDINEKKIRRSLYDDHEAILPDFIVSETVPISVALISRVARPWDSRIFTPIDPTDWTIRAAIGSFREPVGGTFEVSYEGDSSSVLVPAAKTTAADLDLAFNAIEEIASIGGLVVTGADGFFVISFNENGARSILMADATQAIPSLLLEFTRLVIGDASNRGIQTLRIEQAIASLADLDTDSNPAPAAFSVVAATDLFTSVAHGLAAGDRLQFSSTGTLPAGLTDNTNYFVIASGLTADDFRVSTISGGSTVDVTSTGSGVHSWFLSIIEELVAGDATHSEKVRVTLPENRWGGEWTIGVAGQLSEMIGWDDSDAMLQKFIEGIQGVGAGNVSVRQDGDDSYVILFKGALQNLAIAVTADIADLKLVNAKSGALDLRNAQVEFLLDGPEERIVTLELELTDPSDETTKIQQDVLLRRPVVKLDSVIAPFPASNYYTRAQIDALLAGIVGGGGGGGPHILEEFTATLAQTSYPLLQTPVGSAIVFINGLIQAPTEYTTGNPFVFISGAGILAGDTILIFYFY